eukprot:2118546-Amphidinium_carterae.1
MKRPRFQPVLRHTGCGSGRVDGVRVASPKRLPTAKPNPRSLRGTKRATWTSKPNATASEDASRTEGTFWRRPKRLPAPRAEDRSRHSSSREQRPSSGRHLFRPRRLKARVANLSWLVAEAGLALAPENFPQCAEATASWPTPLREMLLLQLPRSSEC